MRWAGLAAAAWRLAEAGHEVIDFGDRRLQLEDDYPDFAVPLAREAGFVVTRYRDEAVGVMTRRDDGELWVSQVTLHPEISYLGRQPTPAERDGMHHKAHHICFIANSVKTEIVVQEVAATA